MGSEVGGSPEGRRAGVIAGAALILFGFCIAGGCGVDDRAPEVVKESASERPADAGACATGEHRCSGSDYQRCANGRWALETACGDLGCNKGAGGCLLGVGAACDSTSECSEGSCLPGPGGRGISVGLCDGAGRCILAVDMGPTTSD